MSLFKKIFSKDHAKDVAKKKETLDKGLEKTKTSFFNKLTKAVAGKSRWVPLYPGSCTHNSKGKGKKNSGVDD